MTGSNQRDPDLIPSKEAFVPVPRPSDTTSISHAGDHKLPDRANASPLDRWLAESFKDQPFNTLAAVQRVPSLDHPAPASSKARSSIVCLTLGDEKASKS
ncbi:hypothetical protein F4679DRAFT_598495 [Xylaria curta]|nr:hypothetical protein F4679DRAFT_598495 [Xylaria curta]